MDYATGQAPVATIRTVSSRVKENLPVETVMDLWSRRIIYGEYAVTWEEMEREVEEGANLVWICATFTPAQQLAEKEASGKKDKSLEEMVPPEYIGYRFVFDKKASERLPAIGQRGPWDHADGCSSRSRRNRGEICAIDGHVGKRYVRQNTE